MADQAAIFARIQARIDENARRRDDPAAFIRWLDERIGGYGPGDKPDPIHSGQKPTER